MGDFQKFGHICDEIKQNQASTRMQFHNYEVYNSMAKCAISFEILICYCTILWEACVGIPSE